MSNRRWQGWGRVAVVGLMAVAACSQTAPRTATKGALRVQDASASQAEALEAVREAVVGWKGGAMPEWSAADRTELDAALAEIDRAIAESRGRARSATIAPAVASGGAGPIVVRESDDVDPRTLYRQQGHRYELVVKAARGWLASDGEDASAEERHLLEAGLRAAKTQVFRLPTLEKQLLRQES